MADVLAMTSSAGVNLSTYTYTSAPRIVHTARKGSTRGNGNPMYDRRVVRGSNYAKRLGNDEHPKWNPYFTNARSLEQSEGSDSQAHLQRRQEFREKLEARARVRRESHGLSSLYPAHHARPRVHVLVQTENYYEPLERPPASETGVQTDVVDWGGSEGSPPPTIYQAPRGVEASTQVFAKELIAREADDGVIAVLVATTMREAVLEVAEEERQEEQRVTRLRQQVVAGGEDAQPAIVDASEDEKNDLEEGADKDSTEERSDPEGKETTPNTEENARSPEPDEGETTPPSSEVKGGLEVDGGVEAVQESESLPA